MAKEFEILDSYVQSQKEFMETLMNTQKELWERMAESTRKMQEAMLSPHVLGPVPGACRGRRRWKARKKRLSMSTTRWWRPW